MRTKIEVRDVQKSFPSDRGPLSVIGNVKPRQWATVSLSPSYRSFRLREVDSAEPAGRLHPPGCRFSERRRQAAFEAGPERDSDLAAGVGIPLAYGTGKPEVWTQWPRAGRSLAAGGSLCRHRRSAGIRGQLPVRAVRRHAQARGAGTGVGGQARDPVHGRAFLGARCPDEPARAQ